MYKTIFKFIIALGLTLLYDACRKADIAPYSMGNAYIDLTGASISADGTSVIFYYSTDNGATFTPTPVLHSGQQVLVKIWDANYNNGPGNTPGAFLTGTGGQFLDIDWSGSNPKPSTSTAGVATFTYSSNLSISAKVVDTHCAFSLASYLGGWKVEESKTIEVDSAGVAITKSQYVSIPKSSSYLTQLSQDPSDPTKVWMANIRGLGLNAYMKFHPSTNYFDQTVDIPSQPIGKNGATFSGSGTYDQCRQALMLNVVYSFVDTIQIDSVTKYIFKDTTFVRNNITVDSVIKKSVAGTPAHKVYVPYQYKWTYTFDAPATIPSYCAFDPTTWAGSWTGDEGTISSPCYNGPGSNDALTITNGASSGQYIVSNWFGDGSSVKVTITLNPSTNYFDQLITVKQQSTSDPGTVVASTGFYDQCAGTMKIPVTYKAFGCTFNWTYNIHH